jgi:transcription elongation factor Elf1
VARRRSKWRKTTTILKKLMQEARMVKVRQNIRQCPVCGNPYSLTIEIKVDKKTGKKQAYVRCSACKFEHLFETIPAIADEFWVYSRLLDMVHEGLIREAKIEEGVEKVESEAVEGSQETVGEGEELEEEVEAEVIEEK